MKDILLLKENIDYEWVDLPSRGECYPHKKARCHMAYLTAKDENIIFSSSNNICNKLIDATILDADFASNSLCVGDRNALLVWLRRTGYGDSFNNPVTNSVLDLSHLKYKDFKLKGDINGYFDFVLENGDIMKFRLLTHSDEEQLIKDTEAISKGNDIGVDNIATLFLNASTISVNSNNDTTFITTYIEKLDETVRYKYMRYILDNTPDFDFGDIEIAIDDSLFAEIKTI